VLFTDRECLVLSKEFQLPENDQIVLRIPRRHNLYCFNFSELQPEGDVTCLLAKASLDESTRWHRRMAHVNFKNMNKLAKYGLVNGLPSKLFTNEHNCVACNKGKQHKASYKAITAVITIFEPLQLLHIDLFGPTSIRSIDHKYYSLVVTDDFSSVVLHEESGIILMIHIHSGWLSVCLLVREFLLVALNVPTGRTIPAGFVDFLEKPKGSAAYHQVLDFLRISHIRGVEDLPIDDIYLEMDNMGYPTEGKLTFHKNKFSPQWRFIIHTIMHCLSTKSGSWDQFGSSLATALICLTEGRKFNWSSYIFKGMVNNITNPKKFLIFPRFLQMILNIETRNSKQYHTFKLTSKMFANMRLNFHGDTMPLLATMLPPAQPAIASESSGEAEPTIPHIVPETLTEPTHSHDQASSPPRPTTIPTSAQENEQGPFSDPNPASSSRPHASEPKHFTSTNVEDDVFGGSFDISPPRSTEAPPAGTTSGGSEDPNKLTALYSLVNSLVQKIDSQASDLKAHKLVFKEVVGKLVKKVKELEDKLKGRKRKFVMTESDIEEEEEQDVDPLIKLAKAAATAADELAVPPGGSNEDAIPPSSSIPADAFAGESAIPPDVTTGSTAAPSDKGKSPMLEEEPPIRERSFRQREEDRLGAEAARRLYEEEQAEQAREREREEQKQKRQKDVLESAKYYTDADWKEIARYESRNHTWRTWHTTSLS
ncbi:synaptobrevin, longin-like domain protein, partial [Tanacetum coccineum]